MRKNIVRVEPRPSPTAGSAAPEPHATAAASVPEVRGLTRDELRRIVLDIIG